MSECEYCLNYEYDELTDEYACSARLDMDEAERFITYSKQGCPFYNPGDEYSIVKKQN